MASTKSGRGPLKEDWKVSGRGNTSGGDNISGCGITVCSII